LFPSSGFLVERGFYSDFELIIQRLIGSKRLLGGVSSLSQLLPFIRDPRSAFFEDVFLQRKVQKRANVRDSFVVHDVKFRLRERRSNLVLDYLHLGPVT